VFAGWRGVGTKRPWESRVRAANRSLSTLCAHPARMREHLPQALCVPPDRNDCVRRLTTTPHLRSSAGGACDSVGRMLSGRTRSFAVAMALGAGSDVRPTMLPREASASGPVRSCGAHLGHPSAVHTDGEPGLVLAWMRSTYDDSGMHVTLRLKLPQCANVFEAMTLVTAVHHETDHCGGRATNSGKEKVAPPKLVADPNDPRMPAISARRDGYSAQRATGRDSQPQLTPRTALRQVRAARKSSIGRTVAPWSLGGRVPSIGLMRVDDLGCNGSHVSRRYRRTPCDVNAQGWDRDGR
jgi:hypothetical protein